MIRNIFILLLTLLFFKSEASQPLIITEDLNEICLSRKMVRYFEDTTGSLSIADITNLNTQKEFKLSTAPDLINENTSSAYWLHFYIQNQTDKPFRIELFDFDLDEVSLFFPEAGSTFREHKAGYIYPFRTREINHKNISFRIVLPQGKVTSVYMRFKSRRHNVLEPIVRSYDKFLDYGFTEYLFFGLFYGLMLLMIFYNFLYFILLRKLHFLYYVISALGILLYIAAENGTAFQYLWPEYPAFNPFGSPAGLYIGITAMLLFAYKFLHLNRKGSPARYIILTSLSVRTLIFGVQLYYPDLMKWEILDLFFIQLVLIAGIWRYRYKPAKWYIIAYALLDVSFLISGLEQTRYISSSIFTVYSFNAGIILNFMFLSVAIGESIRETYRLKNEAHAQLLVEYKKNSELKEKINRELEQLVKERTITLEKQNIEIQQQKEEIGKMYENLEELVKKRTIQLEERNNRIKEYSFSNSHLVRGPLARILGIINVIKIEKDISLERLEIIEKNAKELDEVVREINRLLDNQ